MTYIYVLSLRDNNLFFQMTVISATLLRKISPQAKILIAIDEITDLKKYSVEYELLLNLNVEILIVKTGFSNCVLSSRFIKLSLPNLVNEQFWYLDSDTLPLINTDSTQIAGDIGMVRDLNRDAVIPSAPDFCASNAAETGQGCEPPRALRSVATWSILTPNLSISAGLVMGMRPLLKCLFFYHLIFLSGAFDVIPAIL